MKVVVSAGGSGGHIYPALSVINALPKSTEVIFVGRNNKEEKRLIGQEGIRYKALDIRGLNRKHIFKNFKTLYLYRKAYKEALKFLKEEKVDMVLGTGSYVTLPVLKAAQKLNIKTFIHEQNIKPGLSNRLSEKKCTKVFISFPETEKYLKNKNVYITGNPAGERAVNAKKISKKILGFDNKPLIVFVMGSLGSITMNDKIKSMIPDMIKMPYNFLIVTGKSKYFKEESYPNLKVIPYLDNLSGLMKNIDLLISRAGATTLSEISALGVPTILVPSPYVSNNHQYKNALYFKNEDAAYLIKEDEFNKDLVISLIDKLMKDEKELSKLKKNASKLGTKDSATKIINLMGVK